VHFRGPVAYQKLAACSAHFDVGIIPFEMNELTRAVHPIKALEYLALGLPVVASPLPDLEPFSKVVRFAESQDEWSMALVASLDAATRLPLAAQRRRMTVMTQSWDSVTQRIAHAIDAQLQRRGLCHGSRPIAAPRSQSQAAPQAA
jgi:hypothetical protein